MNYEHLHNEINVYLKNKNGDKSEIQKTTFGLYFSREPFE